MALGNLSIAPIISLGDMEVAMSVINTDNKYNEAPMESLDSRLEKEEELNGEEVYGEIDGEEIGNTGESMEIHIEDTEIRGGAWNENDGNLQSISGAQESEYDDPSSFESMQDGGECDNEDFDFDDFDFEMDSEGEDEDSESGYSTEGKEESTEKRVCEPDENEEEELEFEFDTEDEDGDIFDFGEEDEDNSEEELFEISADEEPVVEVAQTPVKEFNATEDKVIKEKNSEDSELSRREQELLERERRLAELEQQLKEKELEAKMKEIERREAQLKQIEEQKERERRILEQREREKREAEQRERLRQAQVRQNTVVSNNTENRQNIVTAQKPNVQVTKSSPNYSEMSTDAMWKFAKDWMIKAGVEKRLVDRKAMEAEFGVNNVKRLAQKGYIIMIGKGLTFGSR